MYAVLFRKITSVIEDLQDVQRTTEEMYISSEPPDIKVLDIGNIEGEKLDTKK